MSPEELRKEINYELFDKVQVLCEEAGVSNICVAASTGALIGFLSGESCKSLEEISVEITDFAHFIYAIAESEFLKRRRTN